MEVSEYLGQNKKTEAAGTASVNCISWGGALIYEILFCFLGLVVVGGGECDQEMEEI